MTPDTAPALVVAHPGHEVRLHGWLERARPLVLILTDGSGRNSPARIAATARYLADLGVPTGVLFGRCTDRAVYDALLAHDFCFFTELVDELTDTLMRERIDFVVGDAVEGYNTTHDAFRLVLDAAVRRTAARRGLMIAHYDFPVVRPPTDCPVELRAQSVWLNLPDEVFARKLAAARRHYPELIAEVANALAQTGDNPLRRFLELGGAIAPTEAERCLELFRVECLRPVCANGRGDTLPLAQPFYELHGEQQAAAGHYRQVIRYREHIQPLARALAAHVAALDQPVV